VLAHFSHHLLTALVVPLLPFIRDEFVLDYTQSGLVVSAFTLSYGLSQLPSGWFADRISPRILIVIGTCGVAVAGLLVGLSQTYTMMVVCLVLMGVAGGGYHPAAPPLISALVEPKNRGRVLGIHLIGGPASYFLAPLIGVAIATAWMWRGSFIGLSIPVMIFGIIFYALLGRQAATSKPRQVITEHPGDAPSPSGRLRRLVVFLILVTFTSAVVLSIIAFIPLYMVDHFGASEQTAAVFLAIVYAGGLWSAPLGGYLSDRLGRVPVMLAASFAAGPLVYLINLAPYGVGIGALLVILGGAMSMRMPVAEAYIVDQVSEHRRSSILGIYYFAAMEGGGILTPVLGFLIDRFGFYFSFTIAGAALVAVTLACSMFLRGSRG